MLSCLLLQLEGLNFEPGTWNYLKSVQICENLWANLELRLCRLLWANQLHENYGT